MTFDEGSTGTLCYNTVGDDAASKERLEIHGGKTAAGLEDFRRLEVTQGGSTSTSRVWSQDKGQPNQIDATVNGFCEHGRAPVDAGDLIEAMRVTFGVQESLRRNQPIEVVPCRVKDHSFE